MFVTPREPRRPLRLGVDRGDERVPVEREGYRHDVRLAVGPDRRQASHADAPRSAPAPRRGHSRALRSVAASTLRPVVTTATRRSVTSTAARAAGRRCRARRCPRAGGAAPRAPSAWRRAIASSLDHRDLVDELAAHLPGDAVCARCCRRRRRRAVGAIGIGSVEPVSKWAYIGGLASGWTPMRRRLGLDGLGPQADAGDQPSAADRHDDRVDLGPVLDDLDPDGGLPGDHLGIVVGRDVDRVARRRRGDAPPPRRHRCRCRTARR